MTEKEVYRIWAPFGKKWVDWVRPVAFVKHHMYDRGYYLLAEELPLILFQQTCEKDTAYIVDLPGAESVYMGLALARLGYRPIPVYNGTIEQSEAGAKVDNISVGKALRQCAGMLRDLSFEEDAPPVFMTDSNRLNCFRKNRALFDNSWDLYAQDLPSGDYLRKNGISKVVIVGSKVRRDLKKILYRYQKKEIEIYKVKDFEKQVKIKVARPLFPEG